jgi:hypothetical protein
MMPIGAAHNIAITPTTKLLKRNTATSLNAKTKNFGTITTPNIQNVAKFNNFNLSDYYLVIITLILN